MENKKSRRLHLRIDPKNDDKLTMISKKSKLPKSEVIIRILNGIEIKERPDERFYDVLSNLLQIRDSLQIIAEKAEYLHEENTEKYFDNVKKVDEFIAQLKSRYL